MMLRRRVNVLLSRKDVMKAAQCLRSYSVLTQKSQTVKAPAGCSIRLCGKQLQIHSCIRCMSSGLPPHIRITMPALSPTMTAGNLSSWKKEIGDEIVPGDVLAEIETDKAQMDFECQEEGFLAKILVDGGSKEVAVNKLIAILASSKDDVAAFANFKDEGSAASFEAKPKSAQKPSEPTPAAQKPETNTSTQSRDAPQMSNADKGDRIVASPAARSLASARSIDLSLIKGSGPAGRITKEDVLNFKTVETSAKPKSANSSASKSGQAPVTTPGGVSAGTFEDIPLTNMRKTIASRLLSSKQNVPHYYLTQSIEMDRVLKLRQVLNERSNDKYKLSINDFIVKASALACRAIPEVNSAWHDEFIRKYKNVDISVAVATSSGLITPIVKNADNLGLSGISSAVKDLAAKAKQNKLAPHEYQGGTFTISNLGMYGISHFTAIINPPQSCILAVGGTERVVVPSKDSAEGMQVANVMKVTLSCDHRVVDGAVGAQWLQHFKNSLEDPMMMLV